MSLHAEMTDEEEDEEEEEEEEEEAEVGGGTSSGCALRIVSIVARACDTCSRDGRCSASSRASAPILPARVTALAAPTDPTPLAAGPRLFRNRLATS